MPVYEVCLAITGYAYVDIEAADPSEALAIGANEWEAYKHEADNVELTGVGYLDGTGVTQMNPV